MEKEVGLDKVIIDAFGFLHYYLKRLFENLGVYKLRLVNFLEEEYSRYSSLYFIRAGTLIDYVGDFRRAIDVGEVKEKFPSLNRLADVQDLNEREYLRYTFVLSLAIVRWIAVQKSDALVNYKLGGLLDDVVYNDGVLQLTFRQVVDLYLHSLRLQGFTEGTEPIHYLELVDERIREFMKVIREKGRQEKKMYRPFRIIYAPLYLNNLLCENYLVGGDIKARNRSFITGLGILFVNSLLYLYNSPGNMPTLQNMAQAIKAVVVAQTQLFKRLDNLVNDDAKKFSFLMRQYYTEYVKERGYKLPSMLEYNYYAIYQDVHATFLTLADLITYVSKAKQKYLDKALAILNVPPSAVDNLLEKMQRQLTL